MDKNSPCIVNLQSGSAEKKYEIIKESLDTKYTFEVRSATKFASVYKKVLKLNPSTIILAGGDGTIIKGIQSLLELGYKGAFAILPFGTSNYLARDLSIPLTPKEALDTIKRAKTKKIPLGAVNDEYFALMMTIGLSRLVSANVSDKLKQRIGQAAYIVELVKRSRYHQPFTYEITIDDDKTIKGKSHQLTVYNADLNQQMMILPKQDIAAEHLMLVVPRNGRSILGMYAAFLVHAISFGKFKKRLKVYKAKKLVIKTEPLQDAGVDGEVFSDSTYEITAAKVFVDIVC